MRGRAVLTTVSSRNANRVPIDITANTSQRLRSALADRRVVINVGSALAAVMRFVTEATNGGWRQQ